MAKHIAAMRSSSVDAEKYFSQLHASPATFHFMVDESLGPGIPGRTLPLGDGGALVLINPSAFGNVDLPRVGGGTIPVTMDRVLAHELGHTVLIERSTRTGIQFNAGAHANFSVHVENTIMRQVTPTALQRRDHGGFYRGPRLCGDYPC